MGIVGSRPDDGSALYLKDQNRFSITSLTVTDSKGKTLVYLSPNAFPASKILARRENQEEAPVEFIQDPELATGGLPSFLLKLRYEDELFFSFSTTIRQIQPNTNASPLESATDTVINGLTFIFAPNSRELDTLVTREFHVDPNLHKNSNVELVGAEISTRGSPSVQVDYTWKWQPPKQAEDKGSGWRNTCTFVEYDQRAHRLNTLATFSFWVHNAKTAAVPSSATQAQPAAPVVATPSSDTLAPPRSRIVSSHSYQSVMSDSEGPSEKEPPSPGYDSEFPVVTNTSSKQDAPVVDVSCPRPGEDIGAVEDGPLFRATIKAMEQKTGNMRARMKKVLKKAEAAQAAQVQYHDAASQFIDALNDTSVSNANAVQPALDHYFEKIARQILKYERENTVNLQKLIIDPLSKVYNIDIKAADSKKRDFEDESKDYYSYVGRYLGQRQDSLKEKKRIESDSKYQSKRRNFELKRFDYSSYMQDLHGGRKEQEVLSHLTKYADTQAKSYLASAKKIEEMVPQLEALIKEVGDTDKEYQIQRREREEKRRNLEKVAKPYVEPDSSALSSVLPATASSTTNGSSYVSDGELSRMDSTAKSSLHHSNSTGSQSGSGNKLGPSSSVKSMAGSPVASATSNDKFKGIRDLEERAQSSTNSSESTSRQQRKEGLLWALSRPGSHVDPRGLNKQAWHKFWIVLDQGKLSEYSNWKERLDLHMDPIDLRLASVREARNSERRFCFEVITPNFKRVYQATSEEDMNNWINAVNNALQSAFEGRSQSQAQSFSSVPADNSSIRKDIGSVLMGKSPSGHSASVNHHHHGSNKDAVGRRTTVGSRPSYIRTESNSYNDNPTKLLEEIRARDQGNLWCADCSSDSKVEWVSINLGIILCIECSGIHRSLGTHVSKVRSLTLDTYSFTNDIVEMIMQIGNRISNQIWEARLDQSTKPGPNATRDQRLRFITEKYVERTYVRPLDGSSPYATPDDTLLASVKKDDIQNVLYALALRASPNAADRMRNTHAVFLALAAADPASPHPPASSSSSSSTGPNSSVVGNTTPTSSSSGTPTANHHFSGLSPLPAPRRSPAVRYGSSYDPSLRDGSSSSNSKQTATIATTTAFPIAELLLQNGGEIPSTLPAFPLGPAAQQFFEQRTAAKKRASAVGPAGGDTLTALPSIASAGGGGGGGGSSSGAGGAGGAAAGGVAGSAGGGGTGSGSLSSAASSFSSSAPGGAAGSDSLGSRLQKRTSAGARFGGRAHGVG